LASIGQIPAQNLGLDALVNISEATLAGLETGKERKSAEIQTCLGESFEQMLRACAHITGDTTAAEDFESEVKWQDATARSLAESVDALVKMRQGLDVPEEMAWEDIPGWTNAKGGPGHPTPQAGAGPDGRHAAADRAARRQRHRR
jgi:hypothetical protein